MFCRFEKKGMTGDGIHNKSHACFARRKYLVSYINSEQAKNN
jgi:hypothetical protein